MMSLNSSYPVVLSQIAKSPSSDFHMTDAPQQNNQVNLNMKPVYSELGWPKLSKNKIKQSFQDKTMQMFLVLAIDSSQNF